MPMYEPSVFVVVVYKHITDEAELCYSLINWTCFFCFLCVYHNNMQIIGLVLRQSVTVVYTYVLSASFPFCNLW